MLTKNDFPVRLQMAAKGSRAHFGEGVSEMSLKEFFLSKLGKEKARALPVEWRDHIKRVDSLPKPKPSSAQPTRLATAS